MKQLHGKSFDSCMMQAFNELICDNRLIEDELKLTKDEWLQATLLPGKVSAIFIAIAFQHTLKELVYFQRVIPHTDGFFVESFKTVVHSMNTKRNTSKS